MWSQNVASFFQRDRFLHDRQVLLHLVLGLLLNVATWVFVAWNVRGTSDLIPLHYTIYFGIDYFGPWYQVFMLPGWGVGVLCCNVLLAKLTYERSALLSGMLLWVSTLLQALLLWVAWLLVTLPRA